jgi:hypothetical protein
MKPQFLITLLCLSISAGLVAVGAAQVASEPPQSSTAPKQTAPAMPVGQANALKAKALLDQAIQALGGRAYLSIKDMQQEGRSFSFHHGRPTSNGVQFWRFVEFPDKERIEITKQRDIAVVYNGDKGYEITYKGPHPADPKEVSEYLRRRRFSLDTILRKWASDAKVALFYEGTAVAAQKPAEQVTLINENNESVTLDFDADTHLPIRKTFTWRDPQDKQRNTEEEIYDNYRASQGIMTAFGFTRYFNGDMASERFLNSVSYNKDLNPAMFDPDSRYDPNKSSGKH